MSFFIDFSLVRNNKNYRFLFFGYLIYLFGTAMLTVALPYQIYHQTHSTLMVGLLSLFQLLPLLITALWGGILADHNDSQKICQFSFLLLAIGSILLILNSIFIQNLSWPLFIIAAFISSITGLQKPSMDSLRQRVVSKQDYAAASSLAIFSSSFAMIVAPAFGGIIIAHFSLITVFVLNLIAYILALIIFFKFDSLPPKEQIIKQTPIKAITQGFQYAISRQELLGTYLVDFIAMIFGMPSALFPAIAATFGGAKTLGFLYSAPAIGALLISFLSGWAIKVKRHGIAISVAASLWGIAIILFGCTNNLWWSLFFLVLAGGFDAVSALFRGIMWNESVPNKFRGRLSSIEMISYISGPKLGDTESGLVAAAFGVTASIISGGVLCVIGVAICCYYMPKFIRYRSV